ncbi:MAG: hypothetical protein FWC27_03295 [Firmicutes bacterium]|nr:hypothetical protein [Bacillota bacterium]
MKTKSSKFLSVLLTLLMMAGVVAAAPVTARAAAPANPTSPAVWDFSAVNADGGDSYNGGSWSWVQDTKTLTLTDISHTSAGQLALKLPTGATIVLIGANSFTSTNATRAGYSTAISAGDLTIRGSGSLNTQGGNAISGSSSYGIECLSHLTISETASVTATGGTTVLGSSTGIICFFDLTISDNASVTATGDTSSNGNSYGYAARPSSLTIGENASLTATGNSRALGDNYTVPVGYTYYVNTTTAPSAAPLTGNGSTTVIGSTHKYARIASPTSPALALSASSWSPGTAAANTSVTVTANMAWTASSNATSWLTVSPASGTNNGTLTINAAANTGTASRTGTITVTGGGITRTVAVTQAGTGTPIYTLTVNGGTGGGSYTANAVVPITATVPSGKVFDKWTVIGVILTDTQKASASTSFTMPANAVTVTAAFKDPPKGIFGTKARWTGEWWHYLLFFLCFGFIWMWFI